MKFQRFPWSVLVVSGVLGCIGTRCWSEALSPAAQAAGTGATVSPAAQAMGTGVTVSSAVQATGTGATLSPVAQAAGTGAALSPAAQAMGTGATLSPVAQTTGTGAALSSAAQATGTGAMVSPAAQAAGTGAALSQTAQTTLQPGAPALPVEGTVVPAPSGEIAPAATLKAQVQSLPTDGPGTTLRPKNEAPSRYTATNFLLGFAGGALFGCAWGLMSDSSGVAATRTREGVVDALIGGAFCGGISLWFGASGPEEARPPQVGALPRTKVPGLALAMKF